MSVSLKLQSNNPLSPSLSSTSSFDIISSLSRTNTITSQGVASDDEIVWSVSEDSDSEESQHSPTDSHSTASDDFVVLSWASGRSEISTPSLPTRPLKIESDLSTDFNRLSLGEKSSKSAPNRNARSRKRRKGKKAKPQGQPPPTAVEGSYPSPIPTPTPDRQAPMALTLARKSHKGKKKSRVAPGLGARPIVDDMSEWTSEAGDDVPNSMYEEAGKYITTYLANPNSSDRLALLQALIIELGLCSSASTSPLPTLPSSLRAAKALIKSSVFLNIREYIAVRHQGPAALHRVMYPSRSSLIKDIRKHKRTASLKWVKEHGLQVLLVSPYH